MGLVGLILIPKQLVSLQKGKVWKWINSQENGKQRDTGRRWPFTPQGERNEKEHPSGPWKKPNLDTSIPDFQAPDCETVKLCCSNLQSVGLCGASPRKLRQGLSTTEAVVRETEVTLSVSTWKALIRELRRVGPDCSGFACTQAVSDSSLEPAPNALTSQAPAWPGWQLSGPQ